MASTSRARRFSADLALPDIGLTTLSEVAGRGHQIARVTDLPSLIDIDTGFGEPLNAARTVQVLEDMGLTGCHLEDQVNPKRCGHLDGKEIVERSEMIKKISAAAGAKRDPNFTVIARTDSRANEGIDAAIDRAKAYADAGADMIFPEALENEREFETFRKAIDLPMLVNMTEFGKSPILKYDVLAAMGFNVLIYPVSGLRLAMKAVEDGFARILAEGTQESLIPNMQPRDRLYELIRYSEYDAWDADIFDFDLQSSNPG